MSKDTVKPTAFTIKAREDGVAVITIDVPDVKMNVLRADFAEDLHIILALLKLVASRASSRK